MAPEFIFSPSSGDCYTVLWNCSTFFDKEQNAAAARCPPCPQPGTAGPGRTEHSTCLTPPQGSTRAALWRCRLARIGHHIGTGDMMHLVRRERRIGAMTNSA